MVNQYVGYYARCVARALSEMEACAMHYQCFLCVLDETL